VTVRLARGGDPVTESVLTSVAPAYARTVYAEMADPLLAGAVHDTAASVSPGVAVTDVGTPGDPAGVVAADARDAEEVPLELVAVTVNVYAVPFVSPVIAWLVKGGLPDTTTLLASVTPA